MHPHTRVRSQRSCDADTIILHDQRPLSLARVKADQNRLWMAVFDRIVHCFLRDVIQMGRHRSIMNQDRLFTLEATRNSEQIPDLARIQLQRRHQPISIRYHR